MIPLTMLPHNWKRCRQLNPAQLRLAVSWGLRVATTIATAVNRHPAKASELSCDKINHSVVSVAKNIMKIACKHTIMVTENIVIMLRCT